MKNKLNIMLCLETWLIERDPFLSIFNQNGFKTYDKSSIDIMNQVGRPHGGLLWIVNDALSEYVQIEFISNKLTSIKISNIIISLIKTESD